MGKNENEKEACINKNYIRPIYCSHIERYDCYQGQDPSCDFKDEVDDDD